MDTIGSRLRALRESVEGLTPPKLGRLAGLASPAHVRMLESGERGAGISADSALSLCEVLGCTVEYLVRGEGDAPAPEAVRAAVARAQGDDSAPFADAVDLAPAHPSHPPQAA